jgi:hypothetical protein
LEPVRNATKVDLIGHFFLLPKAFSNRECVIVPVNVTVSFELFVTHGALLSGAVVAG